MFGSFDKTPPRWPKNLDDARERGMSDAVMDYWGSFAHNGVPTAKGQPDWPSYAPDKAYMHFGDAPKPERDLMPGMYELHEAAMVRRAAANQAWNWNTGIVSPVLAKP